MIAHGCHRLIAKPAILTILWIIAGLLTQQFIFYIGAALFAALTLFFVIFFRDPERKIPANVRNIVSPADGIVIKTDVVGKFSRVAVFMGPKNVHVNRAPLEGKVIGIKKFSGPKQPAYKDYSEKNERLMIKLSTKIGIINLVQITGIFARRIESYLAVGQIIRKGDRIGIIKFGSRCDVYFPKDKVRITVKTGEKVSAGSSVIGFTEKR